MSLSEQIRINSEMWLQFTYSCFVAVIAFYYVLISFGSYVYHILTDTTCNHWNTIGGTLMIAWRNLIGSYTRHIGGLAISWKFKKVKKIIKHSKNDLKYFLK